MFYAKHEHTTNQSPFGDVKIPSLKHQTQKKISLSYFNLLFKLFYFLKYVSNDFSN